MTKPWLITFLICGLSLQPARFQYDDYESDIDSLNISQFPTPVADDSSTPQDVTGVINKVQKNHQSNNSKETNRNEEFNKHHIESKLPSADEYESDLDTLIIPKFLTSVVDNPKTPQNTHVTEIINQVQNNHQSNNSQEMNRNEEFNKHMIELKLPSADEYESDSDTLIIPKFLKAVVDDPKTPQDTDVTGVMKNLQKNHQSNNSQETNGVELNKPKTIDSKLLNADEYESDSDSLIIPKFLTSISDESTAPQEMNGKEFNKPHIIDFPQPKLPKLDNFKKVHVQHEHMKSQLPSAKEVKKPKLPSAHEVKKLKLPSAHDVKKLQLPSAHEGNKPKLPSAHEVKKPKLPSAHEVKKPKLPSADEVKKSQIVSGKVTKKYQLPSANELKNPQLSGGNVKKYQFPNVGYLKKNEPETEKTMIERIKDKQILRMNKPIGPSCDAENAVPGCQNCDRTCEALRKPDEYKNCEMQDCEDQELCKCADYFYFESATGECVSSLICRAGPTTEYFTPMFYEPEENDTMVVNEKINWHLEEWKIGLLALCVAGGLITFGAIYTGLWYCCGATVRPQIYYKNWPNCCLCEGE